MMDRELEVPEDHRIRFRIGVNLGDVIVEPTDIFGDGVNVAARLEALAEPGGLCVSRVVRDQVRDKLDLAFEDMGEQALKNITRPVRAYRVGTGVVPATVQEKPALALPDKPSIAVLPFANMSGDPEQEYFVDGMVEEIITALSGIRWLFVIARNSSFTYKGEAVDVKRVGSELGVRYVLEGSVRKVAGQVRITAQLIDAISGTHLWADRFDGSLENVFELQDQVAISVAGVIEPTLQAAEMRRAATRPRTDLTAYDFYLRAVATFYPVAKDRVYSALGLLERAIEIDPYYGPALSWGAVCYMRLVNDGWTVMPETDRRKSIDLARQSLRAAQDDPGILINAAFVLGYFGEDVRAMLGLVDRALVLNPSFARGWFVSGVVRVFAGEHYRAIEHLETSLRLSPRERLGTHLCTMGIALFFSRRFDEAAARLNLSIQEHPGLPSSFRFLAACYAHMGRLYDAHVIVGKLRCLTQLVFPNEVPYRKPEDRDLYLSGLRLAVGEET
jgi:adenylate cyclase